MVKTTLNLFFFVWLGVPAPILDCYFNEDLCDMQSFSSRAELVMERAKRPDVPQDEGANGLCSGLVSIG